MRFSSKLSWFQSFLSLTIPGEKFLVLPWRWVPIVAQVFVLSTSWTVLAMRHHQRFQLSTLDNGRWLNNGSGSSLFCCIPGLSLRVAPVARARLFHWTSRLRTQAAPRFSNSRRMRNAAWVVGAHIEPPSAQWDGSWQLAVRWCHLIGQPRRFHNVFFRSFRQTNFCWFSCKWCPRLSDNVLSLLLKHQRTLGLSQVVGVPLSLIASHKKNVYHVLFQLKGMFCLFFCLDALRLKFWTSVVQRCVCVCARQVWAGTNAIFTLSMTTLPSHCGRRHNVCLGLLPLSLWTYTPPVSLSSTESCRTQMRHSGPMVPRNNFLVLTRGRSAVQRLKENNLAHSISLGSRDTCWDNVMAVHFSQKLCTFSSISL